MKTNREKLQHNFLRRVILRIDYKGLIDIKDTVKGMQELLKTDFTEMQEEFINELEFELNDPIEIESQRSIPLKKVLETKSYKFMTPSKDMQLDINSFFIALNINVEEYKKFESYGPMFIKLFCSMVPGNPYLEPLRIGFRKINNCIIKEYDTISKCFNKDIFPSIETSLVELDYAVKQLNSSYTDNLLHENFMLNYVRTITEGEIYANDQSQTAYQIAIDIDGYNNDKEWLKDIIKSETAISSAFTTINDILFKLYTDTLTDSFISELEKQNLIILV